MVSKYEAHVQQVDTIAPLRTTTARIEDALAQYEPISLKEMKSVELMNRTDTKYVMRESQLLAMLQQLSDDYRVLDIKNVRLNHYQTLYYDTSDFQLYYQHHNGKRSRYKVRVREYVDSDLAFFEIKRKTNRENTVKSRFEQRDLQAQIDSKADAFVHAHTPLDAHDLEPKMWNEFQRITLVSKHRQERLTLDLNLSFSWGDKHVALPGIAIAEVKQERASQDSDFIQQIRQHHIQPNRFSKYCAGIYMLYDTVKTNNFKSRILLVNKLMQEELFSGYLH